MEFLDSLLFILILLILLWTIKADFFFIIFGIASFLYFLIVLFSYNPLEIILSIFNFIFSNPLGLVIFFIPIIIYSIAKNIKKKNF